MAGMFPGMNGGLQAIANQVKNFMKQGPTPDRPFTPGNEPNPIDEVIEIMKKSKDFGEDLADVSTEALKVLPRF